MTIQLSGNVEQQLRRLATSQGREVGALVEEAVQQYIEATAITDLDANEVAEAQIKLAGELPGIPAWKGGHE